ncbi:Ig-like domain-containing protein [Salsipaludibacter albus]|uniref:Ig-like domain-containing protein n=1 Tax=Salsipaludibacter albus TaxID=2849650 RepID=UPI001EE4E256|nr:Ig-like domain-containing protein [Salsipaludibacter albus]MBY5161740.1 tandem-95 repeat protein [Salsipaludibacter albus]
MRPLAVMTVMAVLAGGLVAAQEPAVADGRAVEENVVTTGDLGVMRPSGVAWDPEADVLWIGEPGDHGLVGLSRDGSEVLDVRATEVDPTTATIAAGGNLVSVDGGRVTIDDGGGTVDTVSTSIDEATAVTSDPGTGDVVVLDASGPSLVRVSTSGDVTETSLDDTSMGDGPDAVAVDPSTGLVNVADWSTDTVVAVDDAGAVVGTRRVEAASLVEPGAMTFAPSADATDDADATSLFVADAGTADVSGGVVELSLAAVVEAAAIDDVAELIRTTQLSAFSPPSPDSAGVTWLADQDRLLIADSEVNEMPIFAGANLFQTTRGGTLVRTGATLPWSNEPTGLSQDLGNGRLFVSDDRSSGKLHTVRPGPDLRYGTPDDAVTTATMGSFGFGTIDVEDVTYHAPSNTVFVVDGVNAEVWRIAPGPDGTFTGGGSTGDDTITHFDLARHAIQDPEGIVHNVFDDTLLVVDRRTDLVSELTLTGGLIRTIDIGAAAPRTPAGITLAPSSDGLGTSMYVVDRGVDNDADPNENDGRLHELRFPGQVGDLAPIASDDAATTVVDQAVTIDVLANDADLGGDPLTLGGVGSPSDGSAAADPGGTITYTPDPGFVGTDSFAYQVCDPDPQCDTATVTVTVLAANQPPVAVADTVTTGVGVARTIGVLVNDADPEGQVLTVTDLVPPGDGTAVVNADQTVTYTPDAGFAGTDSFTYRVSDGLDTSAPATVTVTVTANWDPPVVVQVGSDTDDAEEAASGTMDRGSSDLEMTQESSVQTVGVRFDGVPVPPGATVTEAWVQFEADETDGTPTTLDLAFQDADDPPTFGVTPFDISARPLLAQSVPWSPPAWNAVGERGPAQRTPDLSPVVQQLVDQPGWDEGNAMVLVVTGTGKRTAEAHDGFPALSPTLHVRFDGGGTGGNTAPDVVASADATFAGEAADLSGEAVDDGLPGGALDATWSKVSGPGTVTFADSNALDTTATFSQPGTYQLALAVDDGDLVGTDLAPVQVVAPGDTGPSTVSFGVFGDYGNGSSDAAAVAAMLDGLEPDFLVTTGDNNYGPGDQDSTVGALYGDWMGNYRGDHGDGAPLNRLFTALGDEDIEAGGGLADYLDFHTLPGGGHTAPADSGNERYYDVVRGPVHLFVLNPHSSEPDGRDVASAQAAWLQAGLAASTTPWQVVVVHDPPYSSNGNDTDTQWPYADWGADLVVSGDRHVYERLEVDGLTYLVSGLGGASIASAASSLLPESRAYYRGGFGAVLATACGTGLTVTFHSSVDGPVDTHTLGVPCGTTPPTPPTTTDDLAVTMEDVPVGLDVLGNDTDPDGDPLVVTNLVTPAHGTAVLEADGTVTYDPDPDFHGVDAFTYTANDGQSNGNVATVTITVTAVDDLPVAVDDAATTDSEVSVGVDVLSNDLDVDGDVLTVTNLGAPAHGTAVVEADGTVTYSPEPGFSGLDTFTYTANDGTTDSNTATVTIEVAFVNTPPQAVDDDAGTDEDVAVVVDVLANDTDVDGQALVVTDLSTPANGSAVLEADGRVTYTPAPDFHGIDTFTYVASDGTDDSDAATVTVAVAAVDDAPSAADDTASTDEGVAVVVDVLANDVDVDGDPLAVADLTPPSHGSVEVNGDGTVTYTPTVGFRGADTFTYTATDATTVSAPATVTVTVRAADEPPVAVDDTVTTWIDLARTIDVLANDADPEDQPLAVADLVQPAGGTAVVNPDQTITYTPSPGFAGVDTFTYRADDSVEVSPPATVTVTVTPDVATVDVQVEANSDDAEEAASGVVELDSTDLEMVQEASVQTVGLRFDGVAIPRGATITTARVQFQVDETDGRTTQLDLALQDADDPPTFGPGAFDLSSRPVLDEPVTWTPPSWSPVGQRGAAQQTPDLARLVQELVDRPGWSSGNAVALLVSGSGKRTAEAHDGVPDQAATLHVAWASEGATTDNQAPVAAADTASTGIGLARTIAVLANDSDPDGQPLQVVDLAQPGHGTVVVNVDRTVTYTPDPGFTGVDTFTYRASDGLDVSAPATVTVTVTGDVTSIAVQVAADSDDAEEGASGVVDLGSSDLEMVQEATVQTVGLRFDGVAVPPGAIIESARVQFQADETDGQVTTLQVALQQADDPPTFSSAAFDLTSRPRLGSPVPWTPPSWNVVGERGPAQQTPNLAALLQQLVDRPGWASGNAVVVLVQGTGKRTAEAHDGVADQSATLHLTYRSGT